MRVAAVALAILAMAGPAAAETVQLFAAGSLKDALTEVAKTYEAKSGHKVAMKFGPSGLLRKEIADGAKADVFASANMEHPQALNDDGTSGPVVRFARNRLCALVKPGLDVTSDTLFARMLDPKVKLATSTPRVDPSGDYAIEVFTKTEALKPGAQDLLEKKALKLTGGKDSAAPPAGRVSYGWQVAEGRADIFLTYCTNALAAQKQYPQQQLVELPEALSVAADYGLTVIDGAAAPAQEFAEFILSAAGQKILADYGFAPGE
jgi:molybdate transport system substrate-binding protein